VEEPETESVESPPVVEEEDPGVADVGTDLPPVEPVVVEDVVPEPPAVRSPESAVPAVRSPESAVPAVRSPESAVPMVEEEVEEVAPPKPKKKRTKPKKKRVPAAAPVPEPASETESETAPESDDGIDWTVPDFPEEPAPPTGTPDTPARNPVVIDEPPAP